MKAFGNIPSIRGLFNFLGQKSLYRKKEANNILENLTVSFFSELKYEYFAILAFCAKIILAMVTIAMLNFL